MGYAPTGLHDCPDIQAELNQLFNNSDSATLREPTPLYDFLMSPINRGGYSQLVSPGKGRLRTVTQRYDQRLLESTVTQPGGARSCTATTQRGDLTNQCTIDPDDYWEVSEVINTNDFREACASSPEIVGRKIAAMINVLDRKVATDMTSQAVALVGNWNLNVENVTDDYLQVQTLKTGTSDVSPAAFEDISAAIMLNSNTAGAAIFSGTTLWKYMRLLEKGCCSTDGIDLGAVLNSFGMSIMFDLRVQKALNKNKAIAIQPGSLQVVTYNECTNDVGEALGVTVGANYQKQCIFHPVSGLPIDLTLSDDCGNISIFARATVKACGLPTDLFAPGDDMEGVTWVNGITVANS